ncbi:hypothetical protein JVT61DRAFT_4857 [Boletus reticuloceps]|uniref:Peptidase metallopeptidase domain-containing protein n=1 Tax=Boletus reticuloceps TaxID=495285 RepID=A0A8I2YN34_9AGAM|nr:hypothetical protein JVT61DRAFT_4857 [Boletus reticuloceps]
MSKPATKAHPGACAVPPPSYYKNPQGAADKGFAIMSIDTWQIQPQDLNEDKQRKIGYCFLRTLGWSKIKENAVESVILSENVKEFETWEHFANIKFTPVSAGSGECIIRIGFVPGSSWSAVGASALNIKTDSPTLNLGWLKNEEKVDEDDRSTILHEFGHALGMMHEHQSPARGGYIHLKELEVYRYYEPLLGSRATVKSQIIDTYNDERIMNMSKFDMKSIMMYFMPKYLNEEGIDIPVNKELSTLDKAIITLSYPPNLNIASNLSRFTQAMIDAGVTDKAAGEILGQFGEETDNGSLADYFDKMRGSFSNHNKDATRLRSANAQLLNSIDPESLTQFGIRDFLGNVINNKLFQSIVKSVVKNTLTQRGIPLKQSIPGASPPEVSRMVGGLAVHPEVARVVMAYKDFLRVKQTGVKREDGTGNVQNFLGGTA